MSDAMDNDMDGDSPLTFPCQFPIKVMGVNSDRFENEIFMIANRHVSNLGEAALKSRASRSANYLSVTVTIMAQSQEQLDTLYRAFNEHPDVKMVL